MTEEEAAAALAAAFEAGVAPWSRSSRLQITCGLPVDAATGESFRGVNTWLLELSAIGKNYRNRSWATRGQWESLGGVVARGEGTPVLADEGGGRTGVGRVLYNVEQVEVRRGAPVAALERFRVAPPTLPDYDLAQRLLDATGARVVPAGRCYCVVCSDPARDSIGMKPLGPGWGDTDSWWSVMFHELVHWVVLGFRRFRWRGESSQGELIAELGAAILTNHCGIPMNGELPTSGEHVDVWVRGTREDLWYFESASDVAWMAALYVVTLSRKAVRA